MALATIGKIIAALGAALVLSGLLLWALGRWLPSGRLPGDIVVRRPGLTVYIPIVTAIVLSLILTLVLNLVGWLRR